MSQHTFTIPGPPVGKGRPRFTTTGIPYTPPATRAAERRARAAYVESGGPRFPDGSALTLDVILYVARPRSHLLKGGTLSKRGREFPVPRSKPDTDNAAKLILDALEGVAFRNDLQVARLTVTRVWSTPELEPFTHVTVGTMHEPVEEG